MKVEKEPSLPVLSSFLFPIKKGRRDESKQGMERKLITGWGLTQPAA